MKKYFCTSDVHSYYTFLIEALNKAGFDKNNKDHILIILGDLFDRGTETLEVYEFIKSIPVERRILIKGNHESLLLDLLQKDIPDSYDYSNGTVSTCCQIAGVDEKVLDLQNLSSYSIFYNKVIAIWDNVKNQVKQHEIYKWLQSDEWLNYYELGKYIFVHSFIPVRVKEDCVEAAPFKNFPFRRIDNRYLEMIPDWRLMKDLTDPSWEDARSGRPWKQFKDGLFNDEIKQNKVLVCGHWHASAFHEELGKKSKYASTNYSIYYGKNIIALDACTAYTKFCNVLIIEEEAEGKLSENCYNTYQQQLIMK